MKQRILSIGLAVVLAAASAPAFAMNASSPAATAPSGSRYSIDTKISELLANPAVADVLRSFVQQQIVAAGKPAPSAEEEAHLIKMVHNMTPRQVARFPQAHMNAEALNRLNTLLAQVDGPASTTVAMAAQD